VDFIALLRYPGNDGVSGERVYWDLYFLFLYVAIQECDYLYALFKC
jgi:hypothetical protein